jgi:hypothetical protein
MNTIRSTDVISKEYNRAVSLLIVKIEKKSRSDIELATLDRLRKRISLLKQTMGADALIQAGCNNLITYSKQILNREEEFFNTMDLRAEYKKLLGVDAPSQDEFIFQLGDSIKVMYNKSTQIEKDTLYELVKTLFNTSVEYKLATTA